MWRVTMWFNWRWWAYLFEGGWPGFNRLWCRCRGHPCGVVWYTSGWEPDMHCKNCGDDLG